MANSSTVSSGEQATASQYNNLRDDVLSTSSGHLHDGSTGRNHGNFVIGLGAAGTDYTLTFNGESNDGVITWDEDNDYFKFSDEILMNSTEKILFGDTGTFIHQSSDGVLTITSDTTVDINGAVAFDGAITGATNITLSGELDAATLDLSSSADIAGDLVLSGGADGALQFTNAGENSIKIPDNQASALIIEEADNAYITFVTTNSSEAITIAKATTFSAGIANAGTIAAGTWNGTAIASSYIAADAITGAKIADDAIDSEHYTDGSIDTAHLADDAITSAKIADDAITSALIADDAITTALIADDAITSALIADNAVTLTTHTTGNYVATITGGTGIDSDAATSGEGTTHTLSVDLNEVGEVAIANGDYIAFMDATDSSATKKEAIADVATLFAGSGLTATNSVIAVDTLNQDTTGTAATVTGAAQTAITSLGTQAADFKIGNGYGFLLGHTTQEAIEAVSGLEWQMHGTANADSRMAIGRWSADNNGPRIHLFKSGKSGAGGTIGTNAIVDDDAHLGSISWIADDGTDLASTAARIDAYIDGTPGANDTPGRLSFRTTADGANSATERMRIASDGFVSIGAIDPDQLLHLSAGNSYVFIESTESSNGAGARGNEISFIGTDGARAAMGSIRMEHDGTATDHSGKMEIWITDGNGSASLIGSNQGGTAALIINSDHDATLDGTLTQDSDIALKTNINTIDSALNKVNQMRGVSYDRVDKDYSGVGVVAQELEKIAPELVQKNHEYKSVAYGNITAYLIEAVKELSDKVKELEAK